MKKHMILAAIVAALGTTGAPQTAEAQSKIQEVPANFPPASFRGRQFVDARGCVYVRAGFDGAVTWVPRVTRTRRHVCGQKPTFNTAAAEAPAQRAPAQRPVQITAPAPAAAAPAPAPKPAARPTRTTTTAAVRAPAPKPTRQPQRVVRTPASKPAAAAPPRVVRAVPKVAKPAPKPAPKRVVAPAKKPAVKAAPAPKVANGACPGLTGVSAKYSRNSAGLPVRCGPQTSPHVTVIRRGEAPGPGKNVYQRKSREGSSLQLEPSLPGNTRIVPRHVYQQRDHSDIRVPAGYRPAWDDDRLNPYRAHQTIDGYRQTQQVWTNTVPRYNAKYPPKRKWYQRQIRATHKEPVIVGRVAANTGQKAYRQAHVSTKSTPRAAKIAKSRYVQIGVFTTPQKAQAAVSRLRAAGLPVVTSAARHQGRAVTRVQVGPFANASALQSGLSATHATGYVQAYIR